ncbi:MAG: hypothetical protein U0T11_06945 [Chitinophagaceae bacterium]
MKQLLLLPVLLLSVLSLAAQVPGELEMNKKKVPSIVTQVPVAPSITEEAIRDKLSQKGYIGKESKGVILYKGVRIPEISNELVDLYLKVERKSRKDKDESLVYVTVSKGYENYVTPVNDAETVNRVISFSANFLPWAEALALEKDIKDQEDRLKSAEKKYNDLLSDGDGLQKKLTKLQQDIEENKSSVQKQKSEVETQRKALEILKSKRKQ